MIYSPFNKVKALIELYLELLINIYLDSVKEMTTSNEDNYPE